MLQYLSIYYNNGVVFSDPMQNYSNLTLRYAVSRGSAMFEVMSLVETKQSREKLEYLVQIPVDLEDEIVFGIEESKSTVSFSARPSRKSVQRVLTRSQLTYSVGSKKFPPIEITKKNYVELRASLNRVGELIFSTFGENSVEESMAHLKINEAVRMTLTEEE